MARLLGAAKRCRRRMRAGSSRGEADLAGTAPGTKAHAKGDASAAPEAARNGGFPGIENRTAADSVEGPWGKILIWNRYFSVDMPFGYS